MDDHEAYVRETFAADGGGETLVLGEAGKRPTWMATYGWSVSYGLPEFIVFGGLPMVEVWQGWWNTIGDISKPGAQFTDPQVWPFTYFDRPVVSRAVHATNITDDWFADARLCRRLFGLPEATIAHQLFWADRDGFYPWSEGASETTRWMQPLLYHPDQRPETFFRPQTTPREHAEFLMASRRPPDLTREGD